MSSRVEVGMAAVALVGSLAIAGHGFGPLHPRGKLDLLGALLVAGTALPLLWSRRAPLAVFVVTAAIGALASGRGYGLGILGIPLGPTAALYLLAAGRSESRRWSPRTTATVVALFAVYGVATAAGERTFPAQELLHTGLAWAVAWFAGERARLLRERLAELEARAEHARHDAERDRRLAVAEERARIARDLHDSAGHAINVIAVRAGAARLGQGRDPERLRLALVAIEEVARQTADDVDRIVHSLREGASGDRGPVAPPGLASLGTLVAHHSQAGLDVSLRDSGARRPLGPAVDQAAYRILQEALTNAARHGAGTAEIELAFGDRELELGVINPVRQGSPARSTGGHGLIGMRERARLLGGSLEAAPADGAFRVSARLPYGGRGP